MNTLNIVSSTPAELLTIDEVAALLKVPKSWIYERARNGAIPHLKLGKYLRFPLSDLLHGLTPTVKGDDHGYP
jgi:excisionase family DNA binding protein